MKTTRVTAYESKTKQAEIFRRAASGENIVVTKNGVPHVEIHRARSDDAVVSDAVKALALLQKKQLSSGIGGSQDDLNRMLDEERD